MYTHHPRSGAIATLAALVIATLSACSASTDVSGISQRIDANNSVAATGNGAPSGPHYNLNIIGVSQDKSPDFSGGNGGRIFVDLVGSTRINLTMGDYQVLDANGTDGTAAFQLPNPDDGSGQPPGVTPAASSSR